MTRSKGWMIAALMVLAVLFGQTPSAQAASCNGTLSYGAKGTCVRELQTLLISRGESTRVTGNFADQTRSAVVNFQAKNGLQGDGIVGKRTWAALRGQRESRSEIPGVDPLTIVAAKRHGVVADANKSDGTLRVVECKNGNCRVIAQGAARFGDKRGAGSRTAEGEFFIFRHGGKDYVSRSYGSAMPYAAFFYRGQAVHYSDSFARGVGNASHGCINVKDMSLARVVHDRAIKIVVHT